jgi:hypothetical protein
LGKPPQTWVAADVQRGLDGGDHRVPSGGEARARTPS